jgi:cyclase
MRLIARLDIKNEFVIKGIHLEGLRKVGNPQELAVKYYEAGIDEVLFMDAVASLYDRNNLLHIIEAACREVFIPITIGGGIRTLNDIEKALQSGADKVAINTGAVNSPELIREAALRFGSQAVVASIEAKKRNQGWEAYIDNGRDGTGKDVVSWAHELESLGAGELLITSVDHEGTKKGFDLDLTQAVNDALSIPVIVCGGLGRAQHITRLIEGTQPSGIACASVLHYDLVSIPELKNTMSAAGAKVREAA